MDNWIHRAFVIFIFFYLFMPQRFHWIGHSRAKGVETHSKQRNRQCNRATQHKYPPRKIRAIGKARQPTVHRKIRNRPCKQIRNQNHNRKCPGNQNHNI